MNNYKNYLKNNTKEIFIFLILLSLFAGLNTKWPSHNDLYSKIDINASMGTSVLESAKFGIPSIVLDFDYKVINKKYKFRWLHETVNYDLGHLINNENLVNENHELIDMTNEFINNSNIISEKSFNYYVSNHSLESVSENLKKQIEKSKLTITDINPDLLKKSLLRRLYEYKKYKYYRYD